MIRTGAVVNNLDAMSPISNDQFRCAVGLIMPSFRAATQKTGIPNMSANKAKAIKMLPRRPNSTSASLEEIRNHISATAVVIIARAVAGPIS